MEETETDEVTNEIHAQQETGDLHKEQGDDVPKTEKVKKRKKNKSRIKKMCTNI